MAAAGLAATAGFFTAGLAAGLAAAGLAAAAGFFTAGLAAGLAAAGLAAAAGFFTAGLAAGLAAAGLAATALALEAATEPAIGCTVNSRPIAVMSFLIVSNRVFAPFFSTL